MKHACHFTFYPARRRHTTCIKTENQKELEYISSPFNSPISEEVSVCLSRFERPLISFGAISP